MKNQRGKVLLLEDVFRTAYPEAQDGVIYQMCHDYTIRDVDRRKAVNKRGREREAKD